jgi:hypothetical protein
MTMTFQTTGSGGTQTLKTGRNPDEQPALTAGFLLG